MNRFRILSISLAWAASIGLTYWYASSQHSPQDEVAFDPNTLPPSALGFNSKNPFDAPNSEKKSSAKIISQKEQSKASKTFLEELFEKDEDKPLNNETLLTMSPEEIQAFWLEAPDQASQLLSDALVSQNLIERSATISKMIATMNAETAREILQVFEETPHSFHSDNNFKHFVHAWAKLDGQATLDYLLHNANAKDVKDSQIWAMSGWAQEDPQSALAFLNSENVPNDSDLYYGLVRGWARTNLSESEAFVSTLSSETLRKTLVGVIAESYVEQHGVENALYWASQTSQESQSTSFNNSLNDVSEAAIGGVFARTASEEPAVAALWLQENLGESYVKSWMLSHTAGKLANEDPLRAIEFVEGLDESLLDKSTVKTVTKKWAETNALDALNWSESLRPELQPAAYVAIINRAPNSQLEDISAWLSTAPENIVVDEALANFAKRTVDDNPDLAFEHMSQMANPDYQQQITYQLLEQVLFTSPDLVATWLPTLTQVEQLDLSYRLEQQGL